MNMIATLWRRFLFRHAGRMPCRLIDIGGKPYLERYYLGGLFGCQVYLHRFVRNDSERAVHDHPWRWALSLLLAGNYTEEQAVYDDPDVGYMTRLRLVRWWNWITPTTRHRVSGVEPETWTLFITGPRFKGWGFYGSQLQHDGRYVVVYHQPCDVSKSAGWHLRALTGDQVGRAPMREAA